MRAGRAAWLVAGGAVVAMATIVAVAANLLFLRSFAAIERKDTLQHITRVSDALFNDLTDLDRQLGDWAAWDDTYAYVVDRNPAYVTSNIPSGTYSDLRLNTFLIYDRAGRMVYGRGFDLETGRLQGIPEGLTPHITSSSLLLRHTSPDSRLSGIVRLPEGLMLIASRPILTSDREGPIRGAMIWGRFLSQWEIRRLGELTHVDLTATPVTDVATLSAEETESARGGRIATRVEPVDRHRIAAVAVVPDIYRQPALRMRIVTPREISAQGRRTVAYFVLWFALAAGAAAAVAVSFFGKLNASRQARIRSELHYQTLVQSASPIAILTLDMEGRVLTWNPAAERIFGWAAEEAVGQFPLFVPPDGRADVRDTMRRILAGETLIEREAVRVRKDGSAIHVSISAAPLREQDGSVSGIVAVLADITGRKRAEAGMERQLRRLASLRAIDTAIAGSLDLTVTLNVILEQVTTQLGVDAADVLLLNPHMRVLDYAASRGFRTEALRHTHLRLGDGHAGRAALERTVVRIDSLSDAPGDLQRAPQLGAEGFRVYLAAPLVAKGEVKGVLELFHRSDLQSSKEWMSFLEALAGQAAIALDNASLFNGLQRANLELMLAYDTTLEGWSRALDLRDRETEGHTQRVTDLTLRLAERMGVPDAHLAHIRRGALLHDIGKMGIPDAILHKPGPLTDEEWAIMRRHPVYARDLLAAIPYLRPALDIPYGHHEKWDGSGYPEGLRGERIPLSARIFAPCDVWDALTSDRPYRKAWSPEQARAYIREQAGKHFDPAVAETFLALEGASWARSA